jgi:lipopolysaccharide export system permease protein
LSEKKNNLDLNDRKFFRNCDLNNLPNVLKELYKRFIIPLYIPVIILIALFIIITSKENINYNKYKLLIYLIGFFLIIFSETTLRFVGDTLIENFKLVIMPLIFLIIIFTFFYSKLNFKIMKNK